MNEGRNSSFSGEDPLDRILAEYLQAADSGQPPDQPGFIARYPEFAPELREFFASQEQFEDAARPFRFEAVAAGQDSVLAGVHTSAGVDEGEATVGNQATAVAAAPGLRIRYFGEYELLEEIARGGMGIVFKARQVRLNRIVALKMILAGQFASAEDVKRFQVEAENAAQLDHPNIVPVYEVGKHKGQHYFTMKLIEGGSLASQAANYANDTQAVATLLATVAHAVDHAHQRGVLHRDLKPGNILLDEHGRPQVTDFGLARRIERDSGLTASGAIIGTPSYMSPEQARSEKVLTTAVDVYSLGAVLYELLTGKPPFREETALGTLQQVREQEPVRPSSIVRRVDRDLETICLKCLQKDIQHRYPSARALADDLDRWRKGEPISARPAGSVERLWRWSRNHRVATVLIATVTAFVLTVAIGGTTAAFWFRRAAATEHRLKNAVEAANRTTQLTLADMQTASGLSAGQGSDPRQALIWFAAAAKSANQAGDSARERADRVRVRAWEREIARPLRALPHDDEAVVSMEFHSSGRYLMTRTLHDRWLIWDWPAEKMLQLPGGIDSPTCLAWSSDGKWLAAAPSNGSVLLYTFPAGALVSRIEHPGKVQALAFGGGGRLLVIAGDKTRVWNTEKQVFTTPELRHPQPVWAVSFNPRGTRLVTACEDGRARVFAISDASPTTQPEFTLVHVRNVPNYRGEKPIAPLFVDEGRSLLTNNGKSLTWSDADTGIIRRVVDKPTLGALAGSGDCKEFVLGVYGAAQVWDAKAAVFSSVPCGSNNVDGVAFSANGSRVITAGWDCLARIWRVDGGAAETSITHQASVQMAIFSPAGEVVATAQAGGLVRIWAVPADDAGGISVPCDGPNSLAKMDPSGRYWMPTGSSNATNGILSTRVYEMGTGLPAGPELTAAGPITDAAFSPDRPQAVTVGYPSQVRFWEWPTGKMDFAPLATPSNPRCVAYSPDGQLVAVFCAHGEILLIDPSDGRVVKRLLHDSGPINYNLYVSNGMLRFSPDSKTLLTWGGDNKVRVWDVANGRFKYSPLQLAQSCHDIDFSPDGMLFATAAYDRTARVFSLATGEAVGAPLVHPDHVFRARFSADGSRILTACGDRAARLWDWRNGQVLRAFQHDNEVMDAAFIPGGPWIITVSHDATARVWDTNTGTLVSPPVVLGGQGWSVFVAPNGTRAVIGGQTPLRELDLTDLPKVDSWSLEDLSTRCEIVSGQRIVEGGGVCSLTGGQWLDRWNVLRSHHPEYPELPGSSSPDAPSPAPAGLPRRAATEPNLTRPQAKQYFALAMASLRAGNAQTAADQLGRAIELEHAHEGWWNIQACLLAYLGDTDRYRTHCRAMVDRFSRSDSQQIADHVAKATMLLPGARSETDVMRNYDRLVAAKMPGDKDSKWYALTKGMAEYRAERMQSCIDWMATARLGLEPSAQATADFFTAMAYHKLGRIEEAERAMRQAETTMQVVEPIQRIPPSPENWLVAQVAAHEARLAFEHDGVSLPAPSTQPAKQPLAPWAAPVSSPTSVPSTTTGVPETYSRPPSQVVALMPLILAGRSPTATRPTTQFSAMFWFSYKGIEPHLWVQTDTTHWEEACPDRHVFSFLVEKTLGEGGPAGILLRRLPDNGFEILIPPQDGQPLQFRNKPTDGWGTLGPIHLISPSAFEDLMPRQPSPPVAWPATRPATGPPTTTPTTGRLEAYRARLVRPERQT